MQFMYKSFSIILLLFTTSLQSTSALAKSIKLYDAPKTGAKAVGEIDLAKGIIPVYTPKNSKWIKIANPNNGDTGWVRQSELTNKKGNSLTFTHKYYQTEDGTQQNIRIFEFGNSKIGNYKKQNTEKALQQQKLVHESIHHMQQQMYALMDEMQYGYQQQFDMMQHMGMPIIMPIVVMPQSNKQQAPQQPDKSVKNSRT